MASEIRAVPCLAENMQDLKERLVDSGSLYHDGRPVTAKD